jgi:tetratricopeptide (TPR) repeat protein
MKLRSFFEAAKYLYAAHEMRPDDLEISLKLVSTLTRLGERSSAIEILNQLVHRFPERGSTWVRVAKLFLSNGEYAVAHSILDDAHRRFPESVDIFRSIVNSNDYSDEFFRILESSILRGLHSPNRQRFAREIIRSGMKRELTEIVSTIIVENLLWKMDRNLYRIVINDKLLKEEFGLAIEYARQWLAESDRSDRLMAEREWAAVLFDSGNQQEAINVLEALLSRRPEDPAPAKWLADALIRSGQQRLALGYLKQTIEQFPGKTSPLKWYLEALINSGHETEALRIWDSVPDQDIFGRRTRERMESLLKRQADRLQF